MVTKFKKILPLILCCAGLMTPLQAQQEQKAEAATTVSIYDTIKKDLATLPHRIPGSPEYLKAVEALEKAFHAQGITLNRQTFPTLVPEVIKKEFLVNGKPVEFYPLAPNNAALISTGEKALEGLLVYIDNERLQRNDFGHVDGKIVLMDWGENYYPKVFFPEGAKAIIFVGNDKATQWDVAKFLSQYHIAFPYFYITRDEAKKHGMLDATPDVAAEKLPKASLLCHSRWKQVEGINLWTEIKGSGSEALFLNARLDTFGTVPGVVAGERQLENVALLAETAVNLSKKNLDNSVFVVFYGSSFNAYDGLRFFYYPVHKRKNDAANPPAIPV